MLRGFAQGYMVIKGLRFQLRSSLFHKLDFFYISLLKQ